MITDIPLVILLAAAVAVVVILRCADTIPVEPSLGAWPRAHHPHGECHAPCRCHENRSHTMAGITLRQADCSARHLAAVPPHIRDLVPGDTEELVLSYNNITDITTTRIIFNFTHLVSLDLSFNRITGLGIGQMFFGVQNLEMLNLDGNNITQIFRRTFQFLPNLKYLFLSKNKISRISDVAFNGLGKLQVLAIADNELHTLRYNWFKEMPSLRTLLADSNHIDRLAYNLFHPLKDLRELYLKDNLIDDIDISAFIGLDMLEHIDLSENMLFEVPSAALNKLESLEKAVLDRNPIEVIHHDAVTNIPVQEISISFMPTLHLVDYNALVNLPKLTTLSMHNNPNLQYIDPEAFKHLPSLKYLYLQNNNLSTLEVQTMRALPSLVEIRFTQNNLHCDCNLRWLVDVIRHRKNKKQLQPAFLLSDQLYCQYPNTMRGYQLMGLEPSNFSTTCPPRILPIFNSTYQIGVGEDLSLHCRALGIPKPYVYWRLSDGAILNQTSNRIRFRLIHKGTLHIGYVQSGDAGSYKCTGVNSLGQTSAKTLLKVHNLQVHIFPRGISSNFATLSWNGTDVGSTTHYQILYRPSYTDPRHYQIISLHPLERSYTITNLAANTNYEVCLGLRHDGASVQLSCIRIRTHGTDFLMQGMKTNGNIAVAVVLGIIGGMIGFICVIMLASKKYRQRQYNHCAELDEEYREPMTHIPLDTLYSPLVSNINS